MPSTVAFSGKGFYVAAGQSRGPTVVRVTFSNVPMASSPTGANDALNPANYALAGPGPSSILSVLPVSGIPEAFDLQLSAPLNIGTWTVTVANVHDVNSSALTAPGAALFTVSVLYPISPLAGGATNDDPESIIRKHLSSALTGPTWEALIAALSSGDNTNWANAESAFDQLFTSTASGVWLTRRANDFGITKPINVGIGDEIFRQYAIKLSTNKVVHQSIREILEIFYGQDSSRAFVEASLDEPYNLSGGISLTWQLDEKQDFLAIFDPAWFSVVSAASAIEVAAALTQIMAESGSDGFAIPFQSSQTGGYRVRIYSGSLGLGSFVRVTGGLAQNVFEFPSLITTYSGNITTGTGYSWVYTNPTPNVTRVTLTINTGLGAPLVNLSDVSGDDDDYVVITASAGIGITGTFPVSNVQISWSGVNLIQSFDIPQISFTGSALQQSNAAYTFYLPEKSSILAASGRTVLVSQVVGGQIDISLPATTQAVNRGPKEAFYGRSSPSLDIARVQRSNGIAKVYTKTPHGLSIGNQVLLDNIRTNPNRPWITPDTSAISPAAFYSISSTSNSTNPGTIRGAAVSLPSGDVLFTGGKTVTNGVASNELATCERFLSFGFSPLVDGTEADGSNQYSYIWESANSMNVGRVDHAISTLGALAFVTGGYSLLSSTTLKSTESYDPGTNTWTNTANMNFARAGHAQIELANGSVIVVSGNLSATTEVYNGSVWIPAGSLSITRTNFPLVQLSSGVILAIGGQTNYGATPVAATNFTEISANNSITWAKGGRMAYARAYHQATLLPNDFVMVTGGIGYNPTNQVPAQGGSLNYVEIYDPNTKRWEASTPSGIRRHGHMAIYLPARGEVVVFGGFSSQGDDVTIIESFNVATRTWKTWPSKLILSREGAVGGISGDQIVAMGGITNTNIISAPPQGAILDGNCFAMWRAENNLDDAGNYNLTSSSGGGYTETIGQINNAFFLDKTTTNVGYYAPTLNSDLLYLRNGAYSVEAWVYLRDIPVIQEFVLIENGLAFSFTAADTIQVQVGILQSLQVYVNQWHNPSTSTQTTSSGVIPLNTWTHIAAVRTPTGPTFTFQIYINGVLDTTATGVTGLDGPTFAAVGTLQHYIGIGAYVDIAGPGNQGPPGNMNIDDIRFSKVARSASDIQTTWERGIGITSLAGDTRPSFEILIPASNTISSGGLNGIFRVSNVLSSTVFAIDQSDQPDLGYASTTGSSYSGQAPFGGFWNISTGSRTANVTTLVFMLPPGIAAHDIDVGDVVFVNSETAPFSPGLFTVTAVTNNSISYSDTGTTTGSTPIVGAVSQNSAPLAVAHAAAAVHQSANDPGPYVYDPDEGIAITDISSTTAGFVLSANQQYANIEVAGQGLFPNAPGWIVLGFGTKNQTPPIALLGTYAGPLSTTILNIDFGYKFTADFPLGSDVTLLAQREAFVPVHPEQVGSAYITASSAGRVAAEAAAEAALAAGITPNIHIVYPGDRGLGAEGFPTFDPPKLSDIVEIYAGDDINADEAIARAQPGVPHEDRVVRTAVFGGTGPVLPNIPTPYQWVLGPVFDNAWGVFSNMAAATLHDGRTLLIGGNTDGYGGAVQSQNSFLMDASGSSLSIVANLNYTRTKGVAVTLFSGQVLVIGSNLICEVYDPVGNIWTPTGTIPAVGVGALIYHQASLLADGTVLVIGGFDNDGTFNTFSTTTTFRWDPNSGNWSTWAPRPGGPIAGHSQYVLSDGMSVLIAGGTTPGHVAIATSQIYNAATNIWTSTGPLPSARAMAASAKLIDGRLLIAGGTNHVQTGISVTDFSTAYTYSEASGSWTAVGSMHYARQNGGANNALRFADGRVIVIAGQTEVAQVPAQTSNTTEIFDPTSNTWSIGPSLPIHLNNAAVALLGLGTACVFGGNGDDTVYAPTGVTYQAIPAFSRPIITSFTGGLSMSTPRVGSGVVKLFEGRVVVTGGESSGTPTNSTDGYSDSAAYNGYVFPGMATARSYHGVALLHDSVTPKPFASEKIGAANVAIFVVGGHATQSAEYLNWVTNTWHTTDPYPSGVSAWSEFGIVTLQSGKVLVCGGHDFSVDGTYQFASNGVNIWDPATGHWSSAAPMNKQRLGHACVLLNSGKVWVAGGETSDGETGFGTNTTETYDPVGNTWTLGPNLVDNKAFPLFQLLNDGTVLIAGGVDNLNGTNVAAHTTTQIYDPVGNTLTTVGPMITGRARVPLVKFTNGTAVAFCGDTQELSGAPTVHCEAFDPVSKTWSALPDNSVAVSTPQTALIGCNTIYSFGGIVGGSAVASTYHSNPVK